MIYSGYGSSSDFLRAPDPGKDSGSGPNPINFKMLENDSKKKYNFKFESGLVK